MLALVLAFQKIQACLKNEEIKEDKTIHLMPVVYVINVRHDENNVFSILKPSTVVLPREAAFSSIQTQTSGATSVPVFFRRRGGR